MLAIGTIASAVLLLIVLNSAPGVSYYEDDCESYGGGKKIRHRVISHHERRSTGYTWASETFLEDRFLVRDRGWYRFKSRAGDRMPEECVHMGQCDATFPIWLNGSHPTTGETMHLKGCMTFLDNCCGQEVNIDVQLCTGDYFIYYLNEVKDTDTNFCFGNQPVCHAETTPRTIQCGNDSCANLTMPTPTPTPTPTKYVCNNAQDIDECILPCDFNETCFQESADQNATCISDPCHPLKYTLWENQEKRSTGYIAAIDETKLNDGGMSTGWYRILSDYGDQIPTTCTKGDVARCSTTNPIWISGEHPTDVGVSMSAKACIANATTCCVERINITIRRCGGGYFVYHLKSPPVSGAAYCFGNTSVCGSATPSSVKPICGDTSKAGECIRQCTNNDEYCIEYPTGARCEIAPCEPKGTGTTGGYTLLDNEEKRSKKSILRADETALSDETRAAGWYRFKSTYGDRMVDSCVNDTHRCGTVNPIWLKGTHQMHPQITHWMEACINTNTGTPACCQTTISDIGVRFCLNGYFVYYLKPTIIPDSAYCYGSGGPDANDDADAGSDEDADAGSDEDADAGSDEDADADASTGSNEYPDEFKADSARAYSSWGLNLGIGLAVFFLFF